MSDMYRIPSSKTRRLINNRTKTNESFKTIEDYNNHLTKLKLRHDKVVFYFGKNESPDGILHLLSYLCALPLCLNAVETKVLEESWDNFCTQVTRQNSGRIGLSWVKAWLDMECNKILCPSQLTMINYWVNCIGTGKPYDSRLVESYLNTL